VTFRPVTTGMIKDSQRDILVRFGLHVEKIRREKNLSFRQVAQNCDIDHGNIKKIEKGQTNLTFLTIVELAKGLGVQTKELMQY
jgi:transcriptional regulator with XRE-family HTH domain